ncbi:hypothetical protein L0990_09600 [Vibrio kanaloae]|uniref:hypothetical protein n=1 Tax=Vibrio kanaloae TaxID=170673 RepID=UPI0035A577B6
MSKIRISTSEEASTNLLNLKKDYPDLSLTQIANLLLSEIPYEELEKCLNRATNKK